MFAFQSSSGSACRKRASIHPTHGKASGVWGNVCVATQEKEGMQRRGMVWTLYVIEDSKWGTVRDKLLMDQWLNPDFAVRHLTMATEKLEENWSAVRVNFIHLHWGDTYEQRDYWILLSS